MNKVSARVWLFAGALLVLLAALNFRGWHPFNVERSNPFHMPLFVPSTLVNRTQHPVLERTAELAQDLTTPESLSFLVGMSLVVAWWKREKS